MPIPDATQSCTSENHRDSTETIASLDVERVIAHLKDELSRLAKQRAAILRRTTMVKRTIAGLGRLIGPAMQDESWSLATDSAPRNHRNLGLTNYCRHLLQLRGATPLPLSEILRLIQEEYPEVLVAHKHPAASLRTVLRRLVTYGEAIQVPIAQIDGGCFGWQIASLPALQGDVAGTLSAPTDEQIAKAAMPMSGS